MQETPTRTSTSFATNGISRFITSLTGRTFQPDFVLFLHQSNGVSHTYQLFIEPKGAHLEAVERWKEDFLKEIRTECGSRILTQNNRYRVIGVPTFYNQARANEFKAKLGEVLEDTYLVPGSDD